MEEIGTAFFLLVFAFIAGFILITVLKKSGAFDEKRPIESKESQILKAVKNIAQKIPGMSEEDRELAQQSGTWFTTADLSQTWEYLLNHFKNNPQVLTGFQYAWKRIDDNHSYRMIRMLASWRDHIPGAISPVANAPDSPSMDIEHQVVLMLKFQPLDDGGTAIAFEYQIMSSPPQLFQSPPALSLVSGTNRIIRNLCLQLTQNPDRGSIF